MKAERMSPKLGLCSCKCIFPVDVNGAPCLLEVLIDLVMREGPSRRKYISVTFSCENTTVEGIGVGKIPEGSARERVAGASELGNKSFYKDVKMAYLRKVSAQQSIQRRGDAKTRTIAIPCKIPEFGRSKRCKSRTKDSPH